MEITGKIIEFLEVQKGEGKNGEWQKQEFIIETDNAKYPKKVCIGVWGVEKVENLAKYQKVGDDVKCSLEIESREFNSKWYTNIQAWRIEKQGAKNETPKVNEETDDLPF